MKVVLMSNDLLEVATRYLQTLPHIACEDETPDVADIIQQSERLIQLLAREVLIQRRANRDQSN